MSEEKVKQSEVDTENESTGYGIGRALILCVLKILEKYS